MIVHELIRAIANIYCQRAPTHHDLASGMPVLTDVLIIWLGLEAQTCKSIVMRSESHDVRETL